MTRGGMGNHTCATCSTRKLALAMALHDFNEIKGKLRKARGPERFEALAKQSDVRKAVLADQRTMLAAHEAACPVALAAVKPDRTETPIEPPKPSGGLRSRDTSVVQPVRRASSAIDMDAIEAWNIRQRKARDDYRNHPLEKDVATVCLSAGCDNDRAHGRNRCAFHFGAKESADQQDYRARRSAR